MAILIPNAVGFLVPKCGSHFILSVMDQFSIPYRIVGADNEDSPSTKLHSDLSNTSVSDYLTFAFVRNPLSWYQSYWAYRMHKGWTDDVIDNTCGDENFKKFMSNVIDSYPDGYISSYYERYVGNEGDISYVGKLEQINVDLSIILGMCGFNVNAESLRSINKANERHWLSFYTASLVKKVMSVEKRSMKRFGYIM